MPAETKLMDHLFIKVDGSDLDTAVMDDILEVTVDSSLQYPDMMVIQVHDESLKWMSEGPFQLGKEVAISAQPEEGGQSQTLFKGEITSLEPEFNEGTQAVLVVRGYDRSHRLHRGTHSQVFLQMTDSDLASRIAQDAGLRAQVDSTSEVYASVLQHNQTHMEFLTERARRIGYELYVEDSTLHFKKPTNHGQTLELEWGKQLRTFKPRLTLIEQVDEVIVRGWDPKNRQVIVGKATRGAAEPQIGEQKSGAQLASAAFSSAKRVVVDQVVSSQAEADTLAQAQLDEISGAWLEADGVCYGQPALVAGKQVQLSSLGSRFSGKYFVTGATHVYRADSGYTTNFTIHGRRPDGVLSLIEDTFNAPRRGEGINSTIGIVTNNNDPESMGRVKVKFPMLAGDVESHWIRIVAPGAGNKRGFFCLPEVDDEVLVIFMNGDPNLPLILGGIWNGKDIPPLDSSDAVENGKVHQRVFKTREGHTITFIDGKKSGVEIQTKGGHKLTLEDEQKRATLVTASGQKLILDDSGSKVTIESTGDLNVKAGGNLKLEATGNLTLKGQAFSISANASGEVKSSGTLTVQGSLVKIN